MAGTAGGSGNPSALIYCIGPFAVTDWTGARLAFQTQRAKAILAMLALAPRGIRSRAWLRDKLWSDRGEQQASGSLRQALLEIRRALSPCGADLVTADKHTVRLDLSRVQVDRLRYAADPLGLKTRLEGRDPASLDFLEGIDIGDPEFEDWLLVERSAWAELVEAAKEIPAAAAAPVRSPDDRSEPKGNDKEDARAPRIGLGLLPTITSEISGNEGRIADVLVETIARSLAEIQPLNIYDLRDNSGLPAPLPSGRGPEWLIRLRMTPLSGAVNVTLLVYQTARMTLVWSNSASGAEGEAIQFDSQFIGNFLAQCVDRLSRTLFDCPRDLRPGDLAARSNYTALNLMFRLDVDSVAEAENLLAKTSLNDPEASSLGLLSYISSFRIGDNIGVYSEAHREGTRRHCRQSLDADPYNGLSLACLGHVSGFVLRDFETAHELLSKAIALNPHQAFTWDHYALFNLYVGRLEEARRASQTAVMLGSYSPIRFSFETTLAMVCELMGDHRTAIYYGERALQRQPLFKATRRYLVAAYAMTGNLDRAKDLLAGLQRDDPGFSLASLRGPVLGLARHDAREQIVAAYVKAGMR
jgi:tetratricopeptide (TPR) repeat protein